MHLRTSCNRRTINGLYDDDNDDDDDNDKQTDSPTDCVQQYDRLKPVLLPF